MLPGAETHNEPAGTDSLPADAEETFVREVTGSRTWVCYHEDTELVLMMLTGRIFSKPQIRENMK